MNDPYPPQILIVIGNENENKVIRPATLIGIHAGLPAYRFEPPKEPTVNLSAQMMRETPPPSPRDRFVDDTERAMALIGKAFER